MKYLSLFSGIGGFELGIESVFKKSECIGFSEIDKYAKKIYQSHFNHHDYGDITKINIATIPDFDLLVGGFPCQSFSIAGQRKGFRDTRGTLFFDIAKILQAKRPNYFLLENVKGLLSHDHGRTFTTIISTLTDLGYDLQWQVLNSKNFGVPQNRERIFIVGHIRGKSGPKIFPLSGSDCGDFAGTIEATYYKGGHTGTYPVTEIGTLRTHKDGRGFRKIQSGLAPTIPARAREDGSGQPIIVQTARGFNKGGLHKISPTMGSHAWQNNNHLFHGKIVRRLTPVECERLQGFPDNWTACVSDTQRYKTLGNAVTVNVIATIINKLLNQH